MDSSKEATSSQDLNPGPEPGVVLRTRASQIQRGSLPSVSRMDTLTPHEQPQAARGTDPVQPGVPMPQGDL